MAGRGRKNADDALALALAIGATVENAALHAQVSERTAYRRLTDPAFCRRVDEIRGQYFERTVGALVAHGPKVVSQLIDLVDRGKSESARLGAMRTYLEYQFKGHEQLTLTRQLAELRQQVEDMRHGANDPTAASGETPADSPNNGEKGPASADDPCGASAG